ncbi:MAG: hypothetical protein AB8F95_14605 [Bacteroidia bacterium]
MKIKHVFSLTMLCWLGMYAWAQEVQKSDTLPTEKDAGHAFLNLSIPKGDLTLNSSGFCGNTVYKVYNEDKDLTPKVTTTKDKVDNLHRRFDLVLKETLKAKSVMTQIISVGNEPAFGNSKSNQGKTSTHTLYCPDPSIPSDLSLDMGHGHARLDLSDLTLNRLNIKSHFAEIFIQYNKPNRMPMEIMRVKSVQGKIVIKNLEQAHANLVTIENEMDLTKIMIGKGKATGTTVNIRQGMGNCALYIDPSHPLRLEIKEGLLGSSVLPPDFEKIEEAVYVNQAWKARQQEKGPEALCTTIICTLDMGELKVISMR